MKDALTETKSLKIKKMNTASRAALQALKKIEQQDGILTPQAVVDEARSSLSPLHKYFDWDDSRAAEKYRQAQARYVINEFVVTIEGRPSEAFYNVNVIINNEKVRGYYSAEKVLADKDLHLQVIESAIRDIEYWQAKYENLKELKGVINSKKISLLKEKKLTE